MKRFLNTMFFTMLLIVIAGAGIFAGYNAINIKGDRPIAIPFGNYINKAGSGDMTSNALSKPMPAQNAERPISLNSGAKLIFEYNYKYDGTTVVEEREIPYFLAGKGEEDLAEIFSGWQIENFNESGALLKKEILQKDRQHYLVKEYNGFIAVFYNENIDGQKLKEIISTPVSSLPEAERVRLSSGILVQGENALIRLLEDFES